jgi:UDPglucose 6-dehydrogenase
MQIAVIGTGFVGVITAAVFAKLGNTVVALDIDKEKIKLLKKGKIPFFEPNLEELVKENLKAGRLKFSTSYRDAITDAEVIFVCVGTPSSSDGRADLKYVFSAAESSAPYLKEEAIIVIKSTVPPSTNSKVQERIRKKTSVSFYTASVPEFLKEGSAVNDALNPERVIIGSKEKNVINKLLDLNKHLGKVQIVMSPQSAQITKYASNAYLASRIAFINEIANICEKTNADIEEVIKGLGSDKRIGSHYWYPGPGYGGSCFPKDVKELSAFASGVGEGDGLFSKIDQLNESRIPRLIEKFEKKVGGLNGKSIALIGLSFKPNTDDMREAPCIKFIPLLLKKGAKVIAFDPRTINQAKKIFSDKISYAKDVYDAANSADIILLLIEWDEFKHLNLKKLKKKMRGNIFIDTRNIYDANKVEVHGFKYIGIGR